MAPGTASFRSARRTGEEISQERYRIGLNRQIQNLLDAIPDAALLLNAEGQLLVANHRLHTLLQGKSVDSVIGMRPGEVLGCRFSMEGDDHCGSSRWCVHCGAMQAIAASRHSDKQVSREVTLFLDQHATLEVQVYATAVEAEGLSLTLCVFRDLIEKKRRQMLERVFFHDIMNTVGSMRGLVELIRRDNVIPVEELPHYRDCLLELTDQMIEEIDQQRKLLAAERGAFVPERTPFSLRHLLDQVRHAYASHPVAEGRRLQVTEFPDLIVVNDPAIVRRILGNLVKNALEASGVGEEVTLSVVDEGEAVTVQVENAGCIPDDIQRQIFARTISTKAIIGRGVGTYSAKLFTERYLGGSIGFTSSTSRGTRFWITLPHDLPA